jgi:hypothetical protein
LTFIQGNALTGGIPPVQNGECSLASSFSFEVCPLACNLGVSISDATFYKLTAIGTGNCTGGSYSYT